MRHTEAVQLLAVTGPAREATVAYHLRVARGAQVAIEARSVSVCLSLYLQVI